MTAVGGRRQHDHRQRIRWCRFPAVGGEYCACGSGVANLMRGQVSDRLPVYEEDLYRVVHLQALPDSSRLFTLEGIKMNVHMFPLAFSSSVRPRSQTRSCTLFPATIFPHISKSPTTASASSTDLPTSTLPFFGAGCSFATLPLKTTGAGVRGLSF